MSQFLRTPWLMISGTNTCKLKDVQHPYADCTTLVHGVSLPIVQIAFQLFIHVIGVVLLFSSQTIAIAVDFLWESKPKERAEGREDNKLQPFFTAIIIEIWMQWNSFAFSWELFTFLIQIVDITYISYNDCVNLLIV